MELLDLAAAFRNNLQTLLATPVWRQLSEHLQGGRLFAEVSGLIISLLDDALVVVVESRWMWVFLLDLRADVIDAVGYLQIVLPLHMEECRGTNNTLDVESFREVLEGTYRKSPAPQFNLVNGLRFCLVESQMSFRFPRRFQMRDRVGRDLSRLIFRRSSNRDASTCLRHIHSKILVLLTVVIISCFLFLLEVVS